MGPLAPEIQSKVPDAWKELMNIPEFPRSGTGASRAGKFPPQRKGPDAWKELMNIPEFPLPIKSFSV
jgi:hypothetical protein